MFESLKRHHSQEGQLIGCPSCFVALVDHCANHLPPLGSELVRKVRSEGPQHVTVHGRDEVVIIAAEEFRRLKGSESGEALIKAMQASPYRDVDLTSKRASMPVRDISL